MGKQYAAKAETTAKPSAPPVKNPAPVDTDGQDRLKQFEELGDHELNEGTSTYHKFTVAGEYLNGTFEGVEVRSFEEGKNTECAVVRDINGEKHLLAQTIVVNELKKKWDDLKEIGFPVRIIYKGLAKAGTPDQYQNFRLLFEK